MEHLALACAAFLATHFVSSTPLRGTLAGALGARAYVAAYSLAALGARLIDLRRAKSAGGDWRRFAAATSYVPFAAIAQGRSRLEAREIGWRNPAIGLVFYAIVLWLHPAAFGVRAY